MSATATASVDFLNDEAIDAAFDQLSAHRLSVKECPGCKKTLPLVPAAFRPEPASPDGFSEKCAVCDIEEQRRLIETCIAEANLSVNHGLHERSISMIGRASGDDAGVPHLKTLYQRQVEVFGGPEGLASAKAATYMAAKEGSIQRVKILEGIDKLAVKVTETGNADQNYSAMSQEDLARAKREIEERLIKQIDTTAQRVA